MFDSNIFEGHRVGYGSLGELPSGAAPISILGAYRSRFPDLPSADILSGKGATHVTTRVVSGTAQEFTFYGEDGERILGPMRLETGGASPAAPDLDKEGASLPARREGDGLLPSAASEPRGAAPKWVPYALVGGGIVVAGGIIWAVTRNRPVAPNRRRKRRRRRRTSR